MWKVTVIIIDCICAVIASCLDSNLNRLGKILDDSDSTLTRRACDSDSTKITRAYHCLSGISVG